MQAANDRIGNHLGGSRISMNETDARALSAATAARFQNVATLRTYLLTQGYTNATLDPMTLNDMRYAAAQKSGIRTT